MNPLAIFIEPGHQIHIHFSMYDLMNRFRIISNSKENGLEIFTI